jgi:hypothetical protein
LREISMSDFRNVPETRFSITQSRKAAKSVLEIY